MSFDNVRVIRVKDWCDIDNLTQESSWVTIYNHIKDEVKDNENVMLDFKGINVSEPWTLNTFGKILKMNNIYFRFTSYNKDVMTNFVNRIKMKCVMEGLLVDRIETVFLESVKTKSKEEIRVEKSGDDIVGMFNINEGEAVFDITGYVDQIGSVETVYSLEYAIRKLNTEHDVKEFKLITKRMFIQDNIIEMLAKLIIKLDSEGITLLIDTEIEATAKKISLFVYTTSNESYTFERKLRAFADMPLNMAGLMVKYKNSRAVDEFGRSGKGQIVSNRIAIFRGLCIKAGYNDIRIIKKVHQIEDEQAYVDVECNNGKVETKWVDVSNIQVCVDTYHNDKFVTHAEWETYHDGEMTDDKGNEVTELPKTRVIEDINNIGLMDKFLGKRFHFIRATQKSKAESKVIITRINESGNCVRELVTIPERIKIVLQDWGEKVHFELERDIYNSKNNK